MMRIGVVSDTHLESGSAILPKALIEGLKGVGMILVAGDIGSRCVLDQLKRVCPDVRAVWGNMDADAFRESLPEKQIIKAGRYTIGLTHGHGNPAHLIDAVQKIFAAEKVDIIVFGHSHYPVNERHKGVLFFNPGSPTDKIFAPFNSYGILEINDEIKAQIIKI